MVSAAGVLIASSAARLLGVAVAAAPILSGVLVGVLLAVAPPDPNPAMALRLGDADVDRSRL